MKPRKRRTEGTGSTLGFDALAIEGGLLSPEWLSRLAQLGAGMQSEQDYRVPKGLNLRDEIGRFWRMAQAHWSDFSAGLAAGAGQGPAIKVNTQKLAERFVTALLRDCLDFGSLEAVAPVRIGNHDYPIGHAALAGRVPVVIAAAEGGLDALSKAFADGNRRRNAFGLTQEYLNTQEGALWGLATNGSTLRILRDNASLTRPAWIEADMARIFTEERYADFAALWLLLHETRFGKAEEPVSECPLEAWRDAGREEGTRAREQLRRGVEEALLALGQGFLSQPQNQSLRADLQSGALSKQDFYNQLLRLVYRLIFLLTVEERGLLHPEGTPEGVKDLYAQGYGLRRLRERALRRSAHDRFWDLWAGTQVVFRGVAAGEPRLGLPVLGGIFASGQCAALDGARLENRALLLAVFRLAWLRDDAGLARVNWRDMGPEELGSVYESLLELVPQITADGRRFAFATGGEAKGNARKTSGSYYTPDSLVQVLLDQALEPVIADAIARHPEDPAAALLGLSIVDPACGSGHFLLAAARRVAAQLARLQANGTPSAGEYRHALRQVVGRCIFGVDLNPMAVELCKVALWMEAVEPGLPLSFLDAHIQHGNALLGTTPELMAKGIPDAAWEAIEGDDKATASLLRRLNKKSESGQHSMVSLWATPPEADTDALTQAVAELEAAPDASPKALERKKSRWEEILGSSAYRTQKLAADTWCAAFVWPKQPGPLADAAPTNELWWPLRSGETQASPLTVQTVTDLAAQYRFFHWHLQFPQVFAKGGFDVVLGNPPWDTLSPDAKEFFSQWDVEVRTQASDDQRATIDQLRSDPVIGHAWEDHCRQLYSSVAFMKGSGRYSLFAPGNLGKGDFNAYRVFIETALAIVRPEGRAAQIVPEGLYNGANCMKIREELLDRCHLFWILGFENSAGTWFPGVHRSQKFAVYVAEVPGHTKTFHAAFNIRNQAELAAVVSGGGLPLPVSLIREFSPDALALMELSSQRDIDIATKMYAAHPKFGDEIAGTPRRSYMAEVHMGNDRDLFSEDPRGIPLYEGRMVAAYDHRAKGYRSGRGRKADWVDLAFGDPAKTIQPQWYVAADKVPKKVRERFSQYRVGFCDVASPTNERTLVATIIPPGVVCGHKIPTIGFDSAVGWYFATWLAVANSFSMDFIARKKTSLAMTYTILDSLPFPRLSSDDWRTQFIVPRVAQLVCTGPEMTGYWNDLANDGFVATLSDVSAIPVARDTERRFVLDAELDAFVAREIFGLTYDELAYVLDTFPIVEKRDRKAYGEYRTKRVILELYEAMAAAARSGQAYQTRLDPPPADPQVAHAGGGGAVADGSYHSRSDER